MCPKGTGVPPGYSVGNLTANEINDLPELAIGIGVASYIL